MLRVSRQRFQKSNDVRRQQAWPRSMSPSRPKVQIKMSILKLLAVIMLSIGCLPRAVCLAAGPPQPDEAAQRNFYSHG